MSGICLGCGARLSLGPARDTPETAIELRAAEIAIGHSCTAEEYDGDAGYLARCIVAHREAELNLLREILTEDQ